MTENHQNARLKHTKVLSVAPVQRKKDKSYVEYSSLFIRIPSQVCNIQLTLSGHGATMVRSLSYIL